MADYFNYSSNDTTFKPEFCNKYRVAFIVCIFCGDYDFGSEVDRIFLWWEKTGVYRGNGIDDDFGDFDDASDNFVFFWTSIFNFGFCESFDFADT